MTKKHISDFVLGAIFLVGCFLLMSCSHRSNNEGEQVPIRLLTSIQSRSAIDLFRETPVSLVAGNYKDALNELWEGIANDGQIELRPQRYYPADGSTLYLRGFYPQTEIKGNTAHFLLTGNEDLLFADACTGSLARPFDGGDRLLTFRHLLAQLNVSLKSDKNFPTEYRLRSVCINVSSSGASLNLLQGKLSFTDDIAPLFLYRAERHEEGHTLQPEESVSLGYLLVQPGATLTVDMTLSRDNKKEHDLVLNDIPVKFEGGSSETGLAYLIEIKIPTPLSLNALLTHWTDGNNGTGNVVVPGEEKE